ncbi:PHD finger protein 7-like [Coturnix japonica]|uniref:PHD finger protein 7-like n=1 Tax=Coturnix japonica TaxID=93934 RepID=UPI0013A5D043|nr:PHD finger protein 7-like [Coturnix japonica]
MPNMFRGNEEVPSSGNEEVPNSGEPVCMLCRRTQVNPDICGQISVNGGLCAHQFCVFFADGLLKWRSRVGGIFEFPPGVIQQTIQLADQKHCFVCGERGATISCAETGCERSFHLPCAEDGECVTQYFGQYRSFCSEHRPQQAQEAAPSPNTPCIICVEPVGDSTSYHTMMCPVCKEAWFHRGCIWKYAMHAATMCFYCPVCRSKGPFRSNMTALGIQIPVRPPSWWDDEWFQPLRERYGRCDAQRCTYFRGRDTAPVSGLWELYLCTSCGAQGMHRYCSFWGPMITSWECSSCAGQETASSKCPEFSSTSRREVPVPSRIVTGLENASSGPARQAASSPSCSSQLPVLRIQPRVPATEETTTCSHPSEERDASQQHQGRAGRRWAPAAGAESCSVSPTRRRTAWASRRSAVPAPTTRPGERVTGRTRSRSPLQGRASGSQSQPQRRHGGSHTTARGAQSSTCTLATPARSWSLRVRLQSARRKQSRQRRRAPTRSRSLVGRRASASRSRSRSPVGRRASDVRSRSRSPVGRRASASRSRSRSPVGRRDSSSHSQP